MQQIKEVLNKSKVKWASCILGCLIVALLIFQAGMFVGFKKAGFSYRVGEQYFRQMNGRPNDQFMGMNRGDFENSHGAIGKIISISLPSVIISDKDNTEKTILISSSTDIRKFKDSIKPEDLKINDFVTVIGNPNDKAEIEARLVRIMPDPANMQGGFIGTTTIK